jgi:hypothetical protein
MTFLNVALMLTAPDFLHKLQWDVSTELHEAFRVTGGVRANLRIIGACLILAGSGLTQPAISDDSKCTETVCKPCITYSECGSWIRGMVGEDVLTH